MNALDALLVKLVYSATTDGSWAGFDLSVENPRTSSGTNAFASGPAVESAAEKSAAEVSIVGSPANTA